MVAIFLFSMSLLAQDQAQYQRYVQLANIPPPFHRLFRERQLDAEYDFSFHINPFYLRGDFNGDLEPDLAVLIRQKTSSKVGVAIIHGRSREVFVVAAGKAIRTGWDDLSSIDVWRVYSRKTVGRGVGGAPPTLEGEALFLEKSESASGLLYWTGEGYSWYQLGD